MAMEQEALLARTQELGRQAMEAVRAQQRLDDLEGELGAELDEMVAEDLDRQLVELGGPVPSGPVPAQAAPQPAPPHRPSADRNTCSPRANAAVQ